MSLPPDALLAELARRQSARAGLIGFTEYTYRHYQPAAHHRAIAEHLEAVVAGRIRRLMIFMPPRHGKSELASRRFPAWYLGHRPTGQIIAASYSQELARDFGRDVRNLVASEDYRVLFPEVTLAADSAAADRWHTAQGGIYVAAGVGSSITGRGADCLLIDDPVKDRAEAESETIRRGVWDWYTSTAYTRLMPGASVVLIMTRWHHDDLAGRLLAAQDDDGDRWHILSLPAINDGGEPLWPERYPIKVLRKTEQVIGPRDWAALYQQRPSVEGGGIYRREWWRQWPADTPMPEITYLLQVWDTAYEAREASDFNACTVWGVFHDPFARGDRRSIILLGRYRERRTFPELRQEAYAWFRQWDHGPNGPVDQVLIEPKASGRSLIQELQRRGLPVMPWAAERGGRRNTELSKVARAHAASAVLWAGCVYYPAGRKWAEEVLAECEQFPAASHDDITDTVTTALLWLRRSQPMVFPGDPEDRPAPILDADAALQRRREFFDEAHP